MTSRTSITQMTGPVMTPKGPRDIPDAGLTEVSQEALTILVGQVSKLLLSGVAGIIEQERILRDRMSSADTGTRISGYLASVVPKEVDAQDPLVAGREANTPRYDYQSRSKFRPTWTDDTFDPY